MVPVSYVDRRKGPRMSLGSLGLVLVSVTLSAVAQVAFKFGVAIDAEPCSASPARATVDSSVARRSWRLGNLWDRDASLVDCPRQGRAVAGLSVRRHRLCSHDACRLVAVRRQDYDDTCLRYRAYRPGHCARCQKLKCSCDNGHCAMPSYTLMGEENCVRWPSSVHSCGLLQWSATPLSTAPIALGATKGCDQHVIPSD